MSVPVTTPPWGIGKGGSSTAFTRHEAQRFARQLVESEVYREKLGEDMKNRTIAPAIETMLWHYAYGKPIEQVELTVRPGQEDLSALGLNELQRRARDIAQQLEDAEAAATTLDLDQNGNVTKGPWPNTP